MKRPLACLAVVFCSGIFFLNFIKIQFLCIYLLSLIFIVFCFLVFRKRLGFDIFLLCLVFSLGAVVAKNAQIFPKNYILRFISYKNTNPYCLKGLVDSLPVIRDSQTSFIFKVRAMQIGTSEYACSGNIRVYLKGKEDLRYDEELILRGKLRRNFLPRPILVRGLPHQNIYAVMRVSAPNGCVRLNKGVGFSWKRFVFWLREKSEGVIHNYVSYPASTILEAMVLGEKRRIPPPVTKAMIKSGTVHILVVSGFNVGIVAFATALFLKILRLPRQVRFSITILCLVIYCLLTAASPPVVRATVTGIVFLLGFLLQREADIYNCCALAALFILLVEPAQLFDIGFQLSFVSVLSIAYLYPRAKALLRIELLKIKCLRYLVDASLISLSAWLGTAGLVAYHFRLFSPVTVLANIFIVPLATLITLCGFSLICIGLISPALAGLFASTTESAVYLLMKMNLLLIKLPYAYFNL